MAEKTKQPQMEEKESNPFFDATRKVLLASIGAIALAQDEIEDFVAKLIERGEIAEKDGRNLVNEIMDKRKKRTKGAEEEATKRVQEVLDRLNVPTKGDIDELSKKISTLTTKVEELKKETQA